MFRKTTQLLFRAPVRTHYKPVRRFAQTTFRPSGPIGPNPTGNSQSFRHLIQNLDQGGIGAVTEVRSCIPCLMCSIDE